MEFATYETKSEQEFISESTQILADKIVSCIEDRGECTVGLSGGSTPKPVYEELGKRSDIDWSKVFFFLVDERYIDPTDTDSNAYLVQNTLLKHADVPEQNLIFPDTTLAIETCVATYTRSLIDLFSKHAPDIITLGLGTDGHIASLFPPVEESHFQEKIVVHTTTETFAVKDRISVSPLVIMASQMQLLLLRGQEKIDVFSECISSPVDPTRWPLHIAIATGKTVVVKEV